MGCLGKAKIIEPSGTQSPEGFEFLGDRGNYFMKSTMRIIQAFVIITLTLTLVAPVGLVSINRPIRMSDQLEAMTRQNPDQSLRVIVRNADSTGQAEQMVKDLGGKVIKDLHLIQSFTAELDAGDLATLAASPAVSWVSLDAPVKSTVKKVKDPLLIAENNPENYFLDTLGVHQVWDLGYQGEDIGVAVIDSGIFTDRDFTITPKKPHIRIKVSQSFNSESPADDFGHGTHVAGIIGGNGNASDGLYAGIAPKVDLINLKISDEQGFAYESDTVDAMQWVFENKDLYNIRVVNLSIQSTIAQPYHESPLDAAAEILWFNGIVVVAAAGNWQDYQDLNPIEAAPGNDPFIITVGAADENGTRMRDDDAITSFTPIGKSLDGFSKPDIFAPGVDIISVLSYGSDWYFEYPERVIMGGEYFRLSGTSMAAPMVTGAAALLLQAEPDLTPDQVKYRLVNSAGTIESSPYLDVFEALTTPTSESANQEIMPHILLAKMAMIAYWSSQVGEENIDWETVDWSAVNWNAVNWNAVNWNAVNWNAVNWNAVNWNAVNWNAVNWNAVNWNAVNWNAVNWNAVNWNAVNWNAVSWGE
jgi:serine protease AprX